MRKGIELLDMILDRFEESTKWDQTLHGTKSLRIEEIHYQSIGRKEVIEQSLSLEKQNLITIKRDYHLDVDEEMNDSEVLSVLNLEQYSAEFMVKGPFVLRLEI